MRPVSALATGGAVPFAEPSPDAVAAQVDALMAEYAGAVPGASVLVMHQGAPVVRRAYGMADVDGAVVSTPATNYRLASVTKQFTAAAVLLLAEDGRLSLDDPLARWLPSLPPTPGAATLHQVLAHTSGLLDYEDHVPEAAATQVRDADVLRLLEPHDRTLFRPGTAHRYSNSGYALLALVVARVSGRSFPAYLRENIFLPLGMEATLARVDQGPAVPHRAFGHSLVDGAWVRTDQGPTSAVLGDGGVYSSIDDLAKWDAALQDDRLLSGESRRLAFTPHAATDDPAVHYGYGWRITGDARWHSGETIGFRNVIVRWPGRRLTVVVLTNRNAPEPHALALEIGALFP
ncbi:MAG TPA: serine hydrolase domain-containing protein [Xanthomonadaceae bacterium]|nr:serine hydrolase domain-containing protein [Xanthomonadaceae bacterium]